MEIIFRAKTIDTNIWIYGYYAKIDNRYYIITDNAHIIQSLINDSNDEFISGMIEINPKTLGRLVWRKRGNIIKGNFQKIKIDKVSI